MNQTIELGVEAVGFVTDGVEKDVYVNDGMSRNQNDEPEVLNEPLRSMSRTDVLNDGTFMLHVFPVHYFCPVLTTGENVRTPETYCEHKGLESWNFDHSLRAKFMKCMPKNTRTWLIKMKRKIVG